MTVTISWATTGSSTNPARDCRRRFDGGSVSFWQSNKPVDTRCLFDKTLLKYSEVLHKRLDLLKRDMCDLKSAKYKTQPIDPN
jgi:hypothetical protein